MLRSKTMVLGLLAAGAWLVAASPAGAISHEEIVKGAADGATGAAEAQVDGAQAAAQGAAEDAAGGVMDQVDSAQKAVDSGQKAVKSAGDTVDAVQGLGGGGN